MIMPDAGDHAELRDADSSRSGAKARKPAAIAAAASVSELAHAVRRPRSGRRPSLAAQGVLGAEAHAELDAEVDAQPDEQRDEGDRDDVEACRRSEAPAPPPTARPTKVVTRIATITRAERTASHSISTMAANATSGDRQRALGQGAELLVLQRHRAGQAHGDAVRRVEVAASGRRRGCGRGVGPGSSWPKSSLGLTSRTRSSRGSGLAAADQRAPGEERRLARLQRLQRVRQPGRRLIEVGEGRLSRCVTPVASVERVEATPRKLGSAASEPRNGSALISCAIWSLTSLVDS